MPAIDIIIRTYFRDFRWLAVCLRSIADNLHGYRDIVVVMPPSSRDRLPDGTVPLDLRVRLSSCDEYADDYLGQQITKLNADTFSDADYVAILDSDCVFHARCSLRALFLTRHQPVLYYLGRSRRPPSDGWRCCIQDYHGTALPFDALTVPPWFYPASLFGELRATALRLHHTTIERWILGRSLDRVSEVGLLTAQAWLHRRDDFVWRDQVDGGIWPCVAYWSRSPRAAGILAGLSEAFRDGRR